MRAVGLPQIGVVLADELDMRSIVLVCFALISLALNGCQVSPTVAPTPLSPPAPTFDPEPTSTFHPSTSMTAIEPGITATPPLPTVLEPTRSPLKVRPHTCPQQAQRSYQPIGSSHLLVAASKGAVHGLFELSVTDGSARLVVEEREWIAKVAVSGDDRWLVYSTLCEPGVTCAANARPDDPSHWVVADLSGHVYSRTAWVHSADVYAWRLLGGTPEAVKILGGIDGNEEWNNVSGASQIDLPSGNEQSNYFGFSDVITGAKLISTHYVVSLDLKREAHYAFDPSQSEGSIRVGGLPGAESDEWSIPDSGRAGFAGYGYRMAWSPDSKFLAATLANARSGENGELYLLDPETRQAVQMTELADQYGSYSAAPTTWSPGSDKLAIRVDSNQGVDTFVADFRAGRLDNICVESAYGDGVWDTSGRVLAIQQDPKTLWAYTTDEHQLYSVTTDLSVQQIVAWLP